VGNRTTETVNGIGKAYSYDANDRLLAAGATSYGYDAIGNLVLRQDATGTAAYGWDAKRRMTSASVAGKSISYRYSVDDIRTCKTVNGSAPTTWWTTTPRTRGLVVRELVLLMAGSGGGGRHPSFRAQPGKLKGSRLPNVGFLHTLIVGFLQGLPNDQEDLG
jgi:YD repeat-containing protein